MYDGFPQVILKIREKVVLYICSTIAYFSAFFWKIELGKNGKYYGNTNFRRVKDSQIKIGDNCRFRSAVWSNQIGINRPCMISTIRKNAIVSIGSNCGFSGTVIAAAEHIEIRDNVMCGANVTITDTDWHYVGIDKQKKPGISSPICIEENVWIGLNVVVLKGVTIGRDSIIGAGSVVTHSIPARTIAAGQPARVISTLES